jgi:hypothetical protein
MSVETANTCRLRFLEPWTPENHLWGLSQSDQGFQLERRLFSCCGGDGLIITALEPKTARLCGLARRWSLVYDIISQLGLTDEVLKPLAKAILLQGDPSEFSVLAAPSVGLIKQHKDGFLNGTRGRILSVKSVTHQGMTAQLFAQALIAFILSWHYGRLVLLSRPGFAPLAIHRWLGIMDKQNKNELAKPLMLIDASSELWNATNLEPFEATIAFAYERNLPVWILDPRHQDLGKTPTAKSDVMPPKTKSFRQSIGARLDTMRHKKSIDWLSPQAKSRLSELCDTPLDGLDERPNPEIF